jgi:hypothetical protein
VQFLRVGRLNGNAVFVANVAIAKATAMKVRGIYDTE